MVRTHLLVLERTCEFIAMLDRPDVTIMFDNANNSNSISQDIATDLTTYEAYSMVPHQPARFDRPRAYSFFASSSSASPVNAFLFVWIRSCLLSRAALVLSRLACISSFRIRSRCFSALALWICKHVCQRRKHCSLVERYDSHARPMLAYA